MRPALSAKNLGKRFRHTLPRYRTLIGRLGLIASGSPRPPEFWAFQNLDFEVPQGACFGLAGPNGSGKTTLLRVLAGILEPDAGSFEASGTTNAFLRVDAGAQPDLSVRENAEISGVLLGLSRGQALRRTDAALEFAGLVDAADVRLGELSTGQTARLHVAIALESDLDILLVDESLSVGDAAFKAACLERFKGMRADGKTFLVASHDPDFLEQECDGVIRLDASPA